MIRPFQIPYKLCWGFRSKQMSAPEMFRGSPLGYAKSMTDPVEPLQPDGGPGEQKDPMDPRNPEGPIEPSSPSDANSERVGPGDVPDSEEPDSEGPDDLGESSTLPA